LTTHYKIYITLILLLASLSICGQDGFSRTSAFLEDTICVGESYNKNGFNIPRQDMPGLFIFSQHGQELHLYVFPTPRIQILASSDVVCENPVSLVVISINDTVPRKIKIGDIACTDGSVETPESFPTSGKTAQGVIFWISSDETYSWVASPNVETETWGKGAGTDSLTPDIPTVLGWCWPSIDTAGFQNTVAMKNAGPQSIFPLAWLADLDNGWFIPTITQMLTMYAVIPIINNSFVIVGGTPFPTHLNGMDVDWYFWASAQHNSYEAIVVGYDGAVYTTPKLELWNLRQIRYFPLPTL